MKKLLIIIALVAIPLAFSSVEASAAADKKAAGAIKMDTNKDNMVDNQEYNAAMQVRFKAMDKNNDGKVSADELKAVKKAKSDAAKGKKGKKGKKAK